MSFSKTWVLSLLAVPAGGIGWIVGGTDHESGTGNGIPERAAPLTAIDRAATLPDFSAADAAGRQPPFTEVCVKILTAAKTANRSELRQLRKEIRDARYQTDPAYDLAIQAIEETYNARFSGSVISEELIPASRHSFFLKWGWRDMQAAFDAAMLAEPSNHRMFMLQAVFTNGTNRDPQLALRLLRSIDDPVLRDQVSWYPVTRSAQDDPSLYKELAKEFPTLEDGIYRYAFSAMANKDPAKGVAELENVPAAHRKRAQASLLESWVNKDHAAATEWARANDIAVPPSMFYHWAASEPVAALEAAVAGGFVQGPQSGGLDTIVAVAIQQNQDNREPIAAWLEKLDDPALRTRLSVGLLFGNDEPSEAVLQAAGLVADDPNRDYDDFQKLDQVADRIKDSQERRDWIGSLPPSVGRDLMSRQAAGWLKEDAAAFGEYVDSLPTARAQAAFLNGALHSLNGQRSEEKMRSWAEANLRAEALKRLNPKQP